MKWYKDKKRLEIEKQAIKQFPKFRLIKKRNKIGAEGKIYTKYGNKYKVTLVFPENYPNSAPEAYCTNKKLKEPPHTLSKRKLCYFYDNDWQSNYTIDVAISWVADWFDAYDHWRNYGTWRGKEF